MRDKGRQLSHWVRHPHNVRFSDFCALVESFGFTLHRSKGSHHVYGREDVPEILNLQRSRGGKAKPYQIREFDRLLRLRGLLPEFRQAGDETEDG